MTPKEALEFILTHADLCDEGPMGFGWKSDKMHEAIAVLEELVNE